MPTTAHIREPWALLHHTDRNIAKIDYALDFDYPTFFNSYFKRITGIHPKTLGRRLFDFLYLGFEPLSPTSVKLKTFALCNSSRHNQQ